MSKSSKHTDTPSATNNAEDITRLVKDELIGRRITIVTCTDPTWVGKTGIILDETHHTLLIKMGDIRKTIAKKTAIFKIEYQGKHFLVDGTRLDFRPEDRIKKAR